MMNLKMIFREENLDRNDAIVGYVLLYSNLTDMFWLILLHLLWFSKYFFPYITLTLDSAIFVINIYNRLKFEIDKIP